MKKQNTKMEEEEPEVSLCHFCHQPGLSLKACTGCGCEKYCDSTCQKARWPHHKVACKAKRKAREQEGKVKEAAKEQGGGSGSGLRDMGSITAALIKPPQPPPLQHIFNECDVFNASAENHSEELQKMLRQPGFDINLALLDYGTTAAYAAAQRGNDKCLSLLISHGANMSKVDKRGWTPIHTACEHGRYACLEVWQTLGLI
jgi:hypothetical protein